MIWIISMLACENAQEKPKMCSSITVVQEKDQCLHKEILSTTSAELDKLIKKAKKISDPLIRGAAVSAWVRDHNTEITQKQGMSLCEILDGRDRGYCARRLSSPHLKR